jgi:hypothetical protein
LYETALQLRQQQAGAFSPSAAGGSGSLAEQGDAGHQLPDGQRPSGDSAGGVLARPARQRRSR